ncbi:hypothetical protein F4680DRAFT_424858 [Xylaria scruposa]|nr:hypothetical protein F4680DRAFT_424858 [Xylaria scruposa]
MDKSLPPPDPDPPHLPYMPGFVMHVTEHQPPAPFGPGGYPPSEHPYSTESWLEDTPQIQQVLTCPPLDTEWPSNTAPRSGVLTITKLISVGEARGAQLVACNVLLSGQTRPYTAMAKIYDSLYYPFRNTLYGPPNDVVWKADMDYSREAAAYRHLQTTEQQKSSFAPRYYGSWTFDLALMWQGKLYTRPIRLLLIEHITGSSVLSLYAKNSQVLDDASPNAFHYDEAYRLDVLAELLEGVLRQLHTGLNQKDLSPRNVMLVPSPHEAMPPLSMPRVVLIDYNIAVVSEHTKYGRHPHQDLSLPMNPAEFYWSDLPLEFRGWFPARWYKQDRRSYQEWLLSRFGGKNANRFAPIQDKLEFDCNSA